MDIGSILAKLEGVCEAGRDAWVARCPAHDDSNPSLSVKVVEGGKVLLKCHAGCPFESIVAALGLEARDLMGGEKKEFRSLGV